MIYNCGWKIGKINKKSIKEKIPCRGSNPDLNETNGYFKFLRHLQKLVQNNNWCRMVLYYMLWVYIKNIVQFSTIENPMNCKVFKVSLIEKLIKKLKLANSTNFFCDPDLNSQPCDWEILFNETYRLCFTVWYEKVITQINIVYYQIVAQ